MKSDSHKITGILLAGGKSSRMGSDKGILKVNGLAMAEHVIHALEKITSSIIIIANNENYAQFGYPVYKDVITDCGPMGGIYTGLLHSETNLNLVVSCDIPFVSVELLQALAVSPDKTDIVVPFLGESAQPLCARYRKSCAEKLAGFLDKGLFKMKDTFSTLSIERIDTFSIEGFESRQLANINSKKELQDIQQELLCR
ncbi:molybdenum cofactor guanylyltransferase [soil metagenome]